MTVNQARLLNAALRYVIMEQVNANLKRHKPGSPQWRDIMRKNLHEGYSDNRCHIPLQECFDHQLALQRRYVLDWAKEDKFIPIEEPGT